MADKLSINQNQRTLITRTRILGIPVDCVLQEDFHAVLDRLMDSQEPAQIVFLRTRDLLRARRDRSYRKTLEAASLVLPVSKEITRGLHALGRPMPARYYPFDAIISVLGWLERRRGTLYLLGGSSTAISQIESNLRQTFPGARIVGRFMGRYSREMETNICMAIRKASPNLLLVGDGPRGENKWLYRRRTRLNSGIQIYSREFFNMTLGTTPRVSRISFRNGREFLREWYRNPLLVFTGIHLPWFRFLVLMERVFRRR
ncbi:WecB/TagA/CpsF family glycosyltransferase [Spirochaeta lutea]|uniref:WecB/TagA/CpsF family glycosyltransferase n=1 Tax=Spirochaeta lutea TaxID=1480694 RepID=UPI000A7FA692|nr:WecB/TagA/CpsF family glycosyltransferase [Spirochaeta lutea]